MATSSNITLDDLEHLDVDNRATEESHLSYPQPSIPPTSQRQEPVEQPKRLLSDRLYIGNLHPSVDECVLVFHYACSSGLTAPCVVPLRYTLLRVFSKFGKVTKLDFLFHKAGPMKGKPRGYAFIEYGTDEVSICILSPALLSPVAHGPSLAALVNE